MLLRRAVTFTALLFSVLVWADDAPAHAGGVSISEIHIIRSQGDFPFSNYDFSAIDQHALEAPARLKSSPQKLVEYLVRPARNDLEKTRAVFRWVAENIRYDTDSYFSGNIRSANPKEVLQSGKAVCSGYSGLFEMLAEKAGLNVVSIAGFGKGYGYREGQKIRSVNHAWNAVKIDGKWYLLDATWAAGGYSDQHGKWGREFDESYFLSPPEVFALTHLPRDTKWQLLDQPLTREQFQRYPRIEPVFFTVGFDANEVLQRLKRNPDLETPQIYTLLKKIDVHIEEAPVSGVLSRKKNYTFTISSSEVARAALVNNGQFSFMEKQGGKFTSTISPNRSSVGIYVLPKNNDGSNRFNGLLEYEVE